MIHHLEVERKRIEEALEVLRRLHQIRKPSGSEAGSASKSAFAKKIGSTFEGSMNGNSEQPDEEA